MSPTIAPEPKKFRQSSPRFPFISLSKAIERADQIRRAGGGGPVLVSAARTTWGYGAKSSGGHQTIAALKAYGLADEKGNGDKRQLVLSADALKYFKDERPEQRAAMLKKFAVSPKAMRELWSDWAGPPPEDHVARSHLKIVRNYADRAAEEFLAIYRDNIAYAKLTASDSVSPPDGGDDDESTEDSADTSERGQAGKTRTARKPGMNQEIFTLKEGTVVLEWPDQLSADSYEDLEAWAQLILRKVKRHVVTEDPTTKGGDTDGKE